MVCAKRRMSPGKILPVLGWPSKFLVLFRVISSMLSRHEWATTLVREHFRPMIGDGKHIDFWSKDWIGRGELKVIFPRIFALAHFKTGRLRVSVVGCLCNGNGRLYRENNPLIENLMSRRSFIVPLRMLF